MKTLVTSILFALTFVGMLNVAAAKTTINDIRKYDVYSSEELRKSLFEVQKVMQDFELSKSNEKIREDEALAFLELSYKLLKFDVKSHAIDDTGDTDAHLFHKFNAEPQAFGKALTRMTPVKIKFLRQVMAEVGYALKNGQDTGAN